MSQLEQMLRTVVSGPKRRENPGISQITDSASPMEVVNNTALKSIPVQPQALRNTDWVPFATSDPDSIYGSPWSRLSMDDRNALLKKMAKIQKTESGYQAEQLQAEAVASFLPYYVNMGGNIRGAAIPSGKIFQ